MMGVFEELEARGLIAQMTDEEKIQDLLNNHKTTFYIGFDPTADSLHVGHFVQIMVMAHMQRAGHTPIALFGGGTGMVGDPSGKTDMRKMLTKEEIDHNIACFKKQMSGLIDFSEGKAIMANNADWLLHLNYIDFLREVGVHFSVNRMLAAECYKQRLEKGLSFFELNYMIMQSYDFLELNHRYNCQLELGGDDQWSNIIGGVELLRRKEGKEAYGMTFTLLTTSEGKKMGKTEKGAVWLDPEKTTPFEFYQYWRNIGDADVIKCLKILTFLPLSEINELAKLEGGELNKAKEILAFEVTRLIHGEKEALKVQDGARALFGTGENTENMPSTDITAADLPDGEIGVLDLLVLTKLTPSKGEGRRLIEQGGIAIDNAKVLSISEKISIKNFDKKYVVIKKGKKVFHKVNLIG
nr:tyrosine--tRNA ligase [uncultured Caproiciproducens sp.]